jgi:hypothetical protein
VENKFSGEQRTDYISEKTVILSKYGGFFIAIRQAVFKAEEEKTVQRHKTRHSRSVVNQRTFIKEH